jgi:hypothetical protein
VARVYAESRRSGGFLAMPFRLSNPAMARRRHCRFFGSAGAAHRVAFAFAFAFEIHIKAKAKAKAEFAVKRLPRLTRPPAVREFADQRRAVGKTATVETTAAVAKTYTVEGDGERSISTAYAVTPDGAR